MKNRALLEHKGIELSDLQGSFEIDGEKRRAWFFSKLAKGNSGLTLRNNPGATLLAQIVNHLDDPTYDTIALLTPSIVNEDLRTRINYLAGFVDKRLLVVNRAILEKLLAYFEEQTTIDKKDPKKVYSASKSKRAKGRDFEATGVFCIASGPLTLELMKLNHWHHYALTAQVPE